MNNINVKSIDKSEKWEDETKVERAAVFVGRGTLMAFEYGDIMLLGDLETGRIVAEREFDSRYYLGDGLARVAKDCDITVAPR